MGDADVIIVGAGAAGLATAIFAARHGPGLRVVLLDGATKPGAKILVSGGGRCNVTNVRVAPEDFQGGSRHAIRKVLDALPVAETVAFFGEIGVELHEEEHGKLFPDSNSARTVLAALLDEARRVGVDLQAGERVVEVRRSEAGEADFVVCTEGGEFAAPRVVLATGGKSLPRTGSDGFGYELAQRLGHTLVPPVPALAPLVLDGEFHTPLSGISHEVALTVRVEGGKPVTWRGSLLWTHFGASGPVVLNASGHWERARQLGRAATITANLLPDEDFATLEQKLIHAAASRPKATIRSLLSELLPARVGEALLADLGIPAHIVMAHLSRDDRRRLIHGLLSRPLPVRESRGYNHAEVTAGGVPLSEIDPATMASRVRPGLHLVGEILDVDGRIGGFNFQWAWSGGFVAGRAIAAELG